MDVNKNTVVDYVAVTSGSEDDPPASRTPGTRAYVRLLIVMFALVLVLLPRPQRPAGERFLARAR